MSEACDGGHRLGLSGGSELVQVMRRSLQFIALALAVLLAVQPALAAMTCTQRLCGAGQHSADCCPPSSDGSMRNMSVNPAIDSTGASGRIPPNPMMAESGCASQSCCIVSARTTVQMAIPAKSRVGTTIHSTVPHGFSLVTVSVRAALTFGDAAAPAPARYVLYQVLRI